MIFPTYLNMAYAYEMSWSNIEGQDMIPIALDLND